MSSPSPVEILRVPGKLVSNPTDLLADAPYGGTFLGESRGFTVARTSERYPITAEEYGGVPVEYGEAGEVWAFSCELRGFDLDALSVIFPNVTQGAVTQHPAIDMPGPVQAGQTQSRRKVVLAHVPENADGAPTVVLYAAIGALDQSGLIARQWNEEQIFLATFAGIMDASSRVATFRRRKDITL